MKFAYLSAQDAQRLSTDLRAVEGGLVLPMSFDTAPILEAHQMYSRRTACLSGYVFGHPSLGDGCAAAIKVRFSVNQDETRRRGCDEGRA